MGVSGRESEFRSNGVDGDELAVEPRAAHRRRIVTHRYGPVARRGRELGRGGM